MTFGSNSTLVDVPVGITPDGLTQLEIAPSISSNGTASFSGFEQHIPTTVEQTERLFTTRSRAIHRQIERGQYSYIKLLSTNPSVSMSNHLADVGGQNPALGNDAGGPLNDALNGINSGYASFLLTDIRGSFDEKVQITEVFGDAEVTYFFGRQPIQLELSGTLIDSPDNNWFVQWIEMYAQILRGTQLARNYELLRIVLPNMVIEGTITRTSWSQNSQRDVDIPFAFTFLAKKITPTTPILNGVSNTNDNLIPPSLLPSFQTQSDIMSQKSSIDNLVGTIQNPFSTTSDYSSALLGVKSGSIIDNPNFVDYANMSVSGGSSLSKLDNSTFTSPTVVNNRDAFANTSSNLTGIRSSLFSPVYGVLSSLTKLISKSTGGVSSVIGSFTNPIKNTLRDIKSISNQAIGVVSLVNNTIKGFTQSSKNLDSEVRSTLSLLKKTAGVISNAPKTVTQNLAEMVNAGNFPATRKFLQTTTVSSLSGGGTSPSSKSAVLNSGTKYTSTSGSEL